MAINEPGEDEAVNALLSPGSSFLKKTAFQRAEASSFSTGCAVPGRSVIGRPDTS